MNSSLILPMMMFGKFRGERVKKDKDGNTIMKLDKKGKPKPVKEKVWIVHKEENGDPGVYPSVNHMYVNMAKGRKRLTKPAEDLKEKWIALAKMWARDNHWEMTKKEKVVVEVTAYFPNDNIKRDTHNVMKLMMDALEGVIYENDYYALPRIQDFQKVKEGERPYFLLNIYKKDEEHDILLQRLQSDSPILSANG